MENSIYETPCPRCGAKVVSSERTKDDTVAKAHCEANHEFTRAEAYAKHARRKALAKFYTDLRRDLGQDQPFRLNAVQRLLAVTVRKQALSDKDAAEVLGVAQAQYETGHKLIGKRDGLGFYWATPTPRYKYLVCASDEHVVGVLCLYSARSKIKGRIVDTEVVSKAFILPKYRGRGIVLGMYQYLISKFNIQSDFVQSPEGHQMWKRLADQGYTVEVTDSVGRPNTDWKLSNVPLVIRKSRPVKASVLAYDKTWIKKMNQHREAHPKYQGEQKPTELTEEHIFTMQPGALAQELRRVYKDDFGSAMGALTMYKNRAGKNLLSPDRDRIDKAKDELHKLYKKGDHEPNQDKGRTTPGRPKSSVPVQPTNDRKPIGSEPTGKVV